MSRRGRSLMNGGAAIRDELPPLAARYTSTYGADVNYAIYNPMKGKRKDLKSAIDAAIQHQEEDDDKIDKQLMEQLEDETPAVKRSRREAAARARNDAEKTNALTKLQRRERVLPTDRAGQEEQIIRQVVERKKELRRKQGIIDDDGEIQIPDQESTPERQVADEKERQRQEELARAADENDCNQLPDVPDSEYAHLTPEQQQIIGHELQRQGQVLYETQVRLAHEEEDQHNRRGVEPDFLEEGSLYGDATYMRLIKKGIASITLSVYSGSLRFMVLAFWVAVGAWLCTHYTINPALVHGDVSWNRSDGLWDNLSQLKPFVPIAPIEYPIDGKYTDSTVMSQFMHELARQKTALKSLEKMSSLNSEAREKLYKVLPDLVVVEREGKSMRLPSYLYHAIRDDLRQEGVFFNMGKSRGGKFEISSNEQWGAIIERLDKADFAKKSHLSPSDSDVTSKQWQEFLRENNRALEKAKKESPGIVVPPNIATREELIHEMDSEFKRTQKTMREELTDMEKRLTKKLETAVKAAAVSAAGSALTKSEVQRLVTNMVRQAISEAQLDALSQREIRTNYLSVLRKQVNFFSYGSGAAIVAPKTSPNFDYDKHKKNAAKRATEKRLTTTWSLEPATVLEGWDDAGHCWCGSIGVDRQGLRQGTSVVVQLGRSITPQHIVVEHILKGATLEDDARPRDMEIWAYIEEVGLRQRVCEFAEAHFPKLSHDTDGKPLGEPQFNDGFVKIGMFTFPDNADEVYVHQLSPELANMGVQTDQVRVIATTNYGNPDKTCFYRLRLYGQLVE